MRILGITAALALCAFASGARADDGPSIIPQFVGTFDKDANLECDRVPVEDATWLGLTRAMLDSLAYGKEANVRGGEIPKAVSQVSDYTGLMTELLRISKTISNDYRCAEQPLAAFNQPKTEPWARMVAQNLLFSWHQHIELNDRLNAFTKRLQSATPVEMADQMSTMQVDRDKIWHSLMPIAQLVLLKLEDDKRLNADRNIDHLTITLVQKRELRAKVLDLFPDVERTDSSQMDVPTFIASLYLVLLNSKKAADEA